MKEKEENPLKPNRFFIVFFVGKSHNNLQATGNTQINTRDSYIKRAEATELIGNTYNLKEILFTNIIELNESDYNDWIDTETEE